MSNILDVVIDLLFSSGSIELVVFNGFVQTTEPCSALANAASALEACFTSENVIYFGNWPISDLHEEYSVFFSQTINRAELVCENEVASSCIKMTPDGVPAFLDKGNSTLEFAEFAGRLFGQRNPTFFPISDETVR